MTFPLRVRSLADCATVLFLCGLAAAQAPTSPVTYREGGGGGTTDTLCRAVQIARDADPALGAAASGAAIVLAPWQSVALVDFPLIIGTGPGQIPPGAQVQSATLRLWCTDLMIPASTPRTVRATPVLDFGRLGTWHEPAAPGASSGVNWLRRDARPDADIGWNGTAGGALEDSVAGAPSNTAITATLPAIESTISAGGGGPFQAQSWHAFDLTLAVGFWAQGLSNQGVMLEREPSAGSWLTVTYASDEAADPARRPQLVVSYTLPSPLQPWNRIPRLQPAWPASPATPMGCDAFLVLAAVDDDGTPPAYRVLKRPSHGVLVGAFPFVTYRPAAGFSGTDTFSWAACDSWGIGFPQTVSITVDPTPGTQGLVFQDGVEPAVNLAAGSTRASSVNVDPWNPGSTFEETVLRLYAGQRQAYLRFPDIIGTAPGRIPPGSRILDARIELQAAWIPPPSAGGGRSVSFARLLDPLHHGGSWSWREPPALTSLDPGVEAGCTACGVTFRHPDASAPGPPLWAFAEGTSIAQQLALAGDVDPIDTAGFRIAESDVSTAARRSADATASVQAWADGAPNLGWLLRSSDPSVLLFWSDDAPVSARRPRLSVTFRPPAAGGLPAAAAPHADAGPDRTCWPGQTVRLDARRSFHPNGLPLLPIWIQTGGPVVALANTSSLTPEFVAPAVAAGPPATLTFLFGAWDGARVSTDEVVVDVLASPGGAPIPSPLADAGPDATVAELGIVPVTGTASGGSGAANLECLWTQLSGPAVVLASRTDPQTSFVAPAVGPAGATVVLDLAVVDAGAPSGTTALARAQVTIHIADLPGNLPPVAAAGPSRSVECGEWVVLDGSATVDPEGQPVTFTWTQLAPAAPAVPLGLYVAPGTAAAARVPFLAPSVAATTPFVFRLAATDGQDTGFATVTITVVPPLPSFTGGADLAPYRDALTKEEARHLLRRAGAGWHPDDVAAVRVAGLSATVAALLAARGSPEIGAEFLPFGANLASPWNIDPPRSQPFDPWPQLDDRQVEAHWLLHAFRSAAPLEERMVHFLGDRLAASSRNLAPGQRHWALMRATMLRRGSLDAAAQASLGLELGCFGSFRDILRDFALDAETLSFIEGFGNQAFVPNENFAREFLELHTLGTVDPVAGTPNYAQADVAGSARAWTGYQPVAAGGGAQPSFYPAFVPFLHDWGLKTVLAQTGNFGPDDMAALVLGWQGGVPASRFLAAGLLRHFVRPDPPAALVDALAAEIRVNGWRLGPTVATLLRSNAMFSAGARKAIVRTPAEFAAGIARTLRIPLQTQDIVGPWDSVAGELRRAGHVLSDPLDVAGFPKDTGWLDGSGLLRRSEIARHLLLRARTPTSPAATTPCTGAGPNSPAAACGQYPHAVTGVFPWVAPAAVDLGPFLPPPRARRSAETLDLASGLLDVTLQAGPGSAGGSERQRALEYLDTLAVWNGAGAPPLPVARPFDGDDPDPSQQQKLWGLLLLLLEHPDSVRL